jgi:hypothetical protein
MACGFDKGLLAALYDGEVSPEERAEAERHAASCPECARDLQSMKQLSAALKPLGRATAPLSIAEGVLREIGVDRPVRRPWVRWSGLAAAGLLGCVATWYLVDHRKVAPRNEVAVQRPAKKGKEDGVSRRAMESKAPQESRAALKEDAAPPQAEVPRHERKANKLEAEDSFQAEKPPPPAPPAATPVQVPQVPVLLVSSANAQAARRTVEAFLKERQIAADPGPGLLGLGAFVRERFLSMDLSDGEIEQLKGRLRDQLAMTATPVEGRARIGAADQGRGGVKPSGDDKDSAELKKEKSAGLQFDRDEAGKSVPERRKIVLVFEDSPAGAAK